MTKRWVVVDTETTVKCPIGKKPGAKVGTPSPFWPDNEIVLLGAKSSTHPALGIYIKPASDIVPLREPENTLLVGQNIKFDLHQLRKVNSLTSYAQIKVWDTQTAEYLLSHQQDHFASLNQLASQYGGTLKDDKIKAYWDAGVETEDIPKGELTDYLTEDVKNTELVAAQQMQHVLDKGIGPLVWTQMDALRAVADIEYNGFCVSTRNLSHYGAELTNKAVKLRGEMAVHVPKEIVHKFNLDSSSDLSKLLFGGTFEWMEESPGLYKNGKPKTVKTPKTYELPGIVALSAKMSYGKEWKTPKGAWSTSEEVLEQIANSALSGLEAVEFAEKLLEYRFVQKEISTYVDGLAKLIYPDGMLHGQIHTCSTHTGRYSSSKPNLQNMPSSEQSQIRDCFVSRFGSNGSIMTADFKQLEVVALAYLSRSVQLMEDIRSGRDIHYETGLIAGMWHTVRDMTPEKRRVVKTINFGLIYGGGATTLAKQAKCTIETAKTCIEAFYARYPRVRNWHQELLEEVERNAVSLGHVTTGGIPVKTSYLRLCTGRTFEIDQQITPWDKSGMKVSWPINKIKNYPVQGLATGDIVPLLLSKVWQSFQEDAILRERALFVNVVHDEIVLDIDCTDGDGIIGDVDLKLRTILENGPEIFEETFGVEFDLPLKVSINYGKSWGDCKK